MTVKNSHLQWFLDGAVQFPFSVIIFTQAQLDFIEQMSSVGYLDGFLEQLLTAKKCHYSEDSINYYLQSDKLIIEDLQHVSNQWQERLKCTLIRHRGREPMAPSKCIVYLHGMGSTRLQSLNIIQHLPLNYCLCMFDMSGCGKSQGALTTYGIKESQDIQPVINYLHSRRSIKEFALWGRSMGAVAALLYALQNYNAAKAKPNQNEYLKDPAHHFDLIKGIILDSPFHNFRDVAKETAVKNFSIPSIFAETAVNYMEQSFTRILSNKIGPQYNPFLINFTQQINLKIPIIIVYSENDEVVPSSHSERLIKNIKSKFEKILINQCSHNEPRPTRAINSIFQKLEKYSRTSNYENRRFSSTERSVINSQRKRGIFVFTPSKDKQLKSPSECLQSERRFNPSFNFNGPAQQYSSPSKNSPKSAPFTPRPTKLSLQCSQMLSRSAKEDEKQSQIATVDTQTNTLISRKLVGVESEGRGTKILRSMRFNMDRRREVKLGRQKYFQ